MSEQVMYRPPVATQPDAAEVARIVGGELLDAPAQAIKFKGVSTLDHAQADEISFITSDKALKAAQGSVAGLLLASAGKVADAMAGRPRVVVEQPWKALEVLLLHLYPEPRPETVIHPTALVDATAQLGARVAVGPGAVIGAGAVLGDDCIIGAHCILDGRSRLGNNVHLVARVTLQGIVHIGNNVTIHPGAVLGADGFKYEVVAGAPLKIPQVGRVVIEDDVEIGANTTIDRAFLHETRIGRGTKLDNLVQIGHNVDVGPHCFMASQVGVAGSTKIGAGCMFGGQAGIPDNVEIAPGVMLMGKSGVDSSVKEPGIYGWAPLMPRMQLFRVANCLKTLPETVKRLQSLEKEVEQLKPQQTEG